MLLPDLQKNKAKKTISLIAQKLLNFQ